MLPVREDLATAVAAEWERLIRPGTWWTAAKRVAIAAEVRASRSCQLCRERRAALTPYAVSGRHTTCSPLTLSPVLVDAIHRIATDSGRLSERWYHEVVAGGVSEYHFVEMIGVVAMVTAIDTLARGIGCPPLALPEPCPGEPSQEIPAGAEVHSAWVPTVVPEKARGDVARYYEESLDAFGSVVNMQKPLTLVPDEQLGCIALGFAMYTSVHRGDRPRAITRSQAELLGATVSTENDCFY